MESEMNGAKHYRDSQRQAFIERQPSYSVTTIDRFHCTIHVHLCMWSGMELLSYHDGCVPHVRVHVHAQYMKHSSGFESLWWFYHPGYARHCWRPIAV